MNKKKIKILKTIITKGLEFNSRTISETFLEMGLIFFSALLGGVISTLLYKDSRTIIPSLLIIIFILLLMSMLFIILKNRQVINELITEFKKY